MPAADDTLTRNERGFVHVPQMNNHVYPSSEWVVRRTNFAHGLPSLSLDIVPSPGRLQEIRYMVCGIWYMVYMVYTV